MDGVATDLTGVGGFEPPAMGARPEPRELEDFELGCTKDGWQHEASSRTEETFRAESRQGVVTLSRWTKGQLALSTCLVNRLTSFHPAAVPGHSVPSVALSLPSNRAKLPVWPSTRLSRPSPSILCTAGCWGGRGAVENAAARICREAGGRVTTNAMVGPHVDDGRRLEVVADGLPLFSALSSQSTQRCALRADG